MGRVLSVAVSASSRHRNRCSYCILSADASRFAAQIAQLRRGIDLAIGHRMNGTNLPHGETTGVIIEGFHETHRELGSGFHEKVSRNALAIVLRSRGLRVETEVPLDVRFRGQVIGKFFADMVVNETVLVEIKGTAGIEPYAEAQVLNYLKAVGGGVGLLLNFGRTPQHKRLVMGNPMNSLPSLRKTTQGAVEESQSEEPNLASDSREHSP